MRKLLAELESYRNGSVYQSKICMHSSIKCFTFHE